ncbi:MULTISPECIES: molecular chaperone DnaJ [Bradyrhizobium]|jgi:molecular chaperone DnaJ|uniref:molecular chaperone DnaJ n=1 Tax=Bradyrhizobium TaxID=374 RepID=UPI000745E213|nr:MULTISPECIES: molecular chaperone DnaJ [Bradyrhizobium]AMA54935.1 molecular chaperone DnaJ [Bradyrhizobium sp. CCGE-LA001]KYH02457.1 molecular chaperone DnaJ [Bradyrhizobium sp. DOA1]MBR0906124.1 molecular chaperone DnaJ [Bradyrhizobium liaoningense]
MSTSTKRCYYETLEVERDADEGKLKASFRKLAMKFHPDRNPGDDTSEVKFKEINEAYEVLKDRDKRAAYDRYGHAAFEQGGGGAGFGAGFASSFSDIFEDLFGMAGQRGRGGRERGADLRYNMEITLEEAFGGKTAQIEIPVSVTCEACSGIGAKAGTKPKTCSTCGGAGRVRQSQGFFTLERTCPGCQGRGQMIEDACPSCSGQGRVTRERTLSVNIPQGVEDGTRIRLAGEGEAGVRGGPPGDLYIFLSLAQHQFFQRDGADLHCRVPISMVTAALGGEFEVPTIEKTKTKVKVPAGTQSGRRFRIASKGMPVLRSRQMGDMYVQVVVETPQNLTKKQQELLAEFDKLSSGNTQPESEGFFAKVKDFFGNRAS